MKVQFKAVVVIRGAKDQHLYGTDLTRLTARATKVLTENKPDWADLLPQCFRIYERINGGLTWQILSTTYYEQIAPEDMAWRRLDRAQKQAKQGRTSQAQKVQAQLRRLEQDEIRVIRSLSKIRTALRQLKAQLFDLT